MKRETAEKLNMIIQSYNEELGIIIPQLREELGPDDIKAISQPVGHMLALSFDVLDLLWEEYPDLMPDGRFD
ncbi:MAG: hypothetical protein GY934_11130 [Gammaproteobacteria bacterium]|nr:hypothetical protein [Gammaproteobacteria bacterium]